MSTKEWVKVLEVLAEGGSLKVMGSKNSKGDWSFAMVRDESTLAQLIDDVLPESVYEEVLADSWEGILEKMDRYPWAELYPGTVHEDVRKRIWAAVLSRTSDTWKLKNWAEVCETELF